MGKFKWSENKIQQLEAEGRGKGTGASYKPWVEVTDFSSRGKSRRIFSRKTGRVHHLLSDVEWQLFLLLEFSRNVIDIREQYPLRRDETLSLAAQRNIRHPIYPGTKVPAVMTCDFLVTFERDGQKTLAAFSCKRSDGAEDARKVELLEIERAYFDALGIPHHLVFHSELPTNKFNNLAWCRGATINNEGIEEYPDSFCEFSERLLADLRKPGRSGSLAEYCASFEARTGAPTGLGLRVARALLWQGRLLTDLHQKDLAATPVAMFRVAPQPGLRVVGA